MGLDLCVEIALQGAVSHPDLVAYAAVERQSLLGLGACRVRGAGVLLRCSCHELPGRKRHLLDQLRACAGQVTAAGTASASPAEPHPPDTRPRAKWLHLPRWRGLLVSNTWGGDWPTRGRGAAHSS